MSLQEEEVSGVVSVRYKAHLVAKAYS